MADPRFFQHRGAISLAELAQVASLEVTSATGKPDATLSNRMVKGVATLEKAGADDISFLDNPKYIGSFTRSQAGACIVRKKYAEQAPAGMALLISDNPYAAYARVAAAFIAAPALDYKISPAAHIDPTAIIAPHVQIDPGAVIGARVEIGSHSHIAANAVISAGVVLGERCYVGPNSSLSYTIVGNNVTLHQGVRIGQDGFGFAYDSGNYIKVPQLGRVMIGDDVEVGAGTCIDRGSGPDTVIGSGTKIDNLVQIGHNVQIGKGCIIVSQAGISGSTRLGDFVTLGGQSGLTGHLSVGSGARIAAQSGVMRDVPAGATMGGAPAIPIREFHRQTLAIQSLVKKMNNDDDGE